MLLSLILILNPANSFAATQLFGNIECVAQFRRAEANEKVTVKETKLQVVGIWQGIAKHEASLEGRFFSVQENLSNADLLTFIVQEDDDTKGLVNRSALDSTGRFSATQVVGNETFKLVCTRVERFVKQRF